MRADPRPLQASWCGKNNTPVGAFRCCIMHLAGDHVPVHGKAALRARTDEFPLVDGTGGPRAGTSLSRKNPSIRGVSGDSMA